MKNRRKSALCRYGDPKLCKEANDVAFATRFQQECALTFLAAALQLLAGLAQVKTRGAAGRQAGGRRRVCTGGARGVQGQRRWYCGVQWGKVDGVGG